MEEKMKIGLRKFNLNKRIKARTTGSLIRKVKSALLPWYGKKGMGWLHPKRKVYNKIYSKVTFDPIKLITNFFKKV